MLRRALQTALILILLTACRSSTPIAPTPTLTASPSATPTLTPTLVPSPTATPIILKVEITQTLVNCRSGPGTVFEALNELKQGQLVRAVSRDSVSAWWYVEDPGNPGGFCWVAASSSQLQGDANQLPVRQAPNPQVTNLTLIVEPGHMTVDCFQFPQTFFFKAEATADGPLVAQWQWEASGDGIIETGSLIFERAETRIINQYLQVNAEGEYWMKVSILSPTPLTQRVIFRVTCS
ncbi:MAG: hypothetical protein IT311_12300 [Anaerolineales bacterium]|nr:hypothetical protein [Anaerolineales bacterium]MCZ2121477.1 hypothetical protein [Anaerolineales bacterium]